MICGYSPNCAITLIVAVLLMGCGTARTRNFIAPSSGEVRLPASISTVSKQEAEGLLKQINERNKTVEDDMDWIKRSYSGLMVRRLTNVSESEYPGYAQYLDNGIAYVLVHPAYYTFFHSPEKVLDNSSGSPILKENVVEKFLSNEPKDEGYAVLQAQERRTRDFIELMSTEEKLVILVVPKNYQTFPGYTYKKGRDEYMRFLNEATNLSKSILFVESRSPNRGYLLEDDALKLMEFLLSINAKKILIGGGYIGRCLEDFYGLLTEDFGREGIFVVPELSDLSPREINIPLARALLNPDGTINIDVATNNIKKGYYDVQEIRPQIINLHSIDIEQAQ